MSYQTSKNYRGNKKQGPTMLEVLVVGIFKALWFLVKLPFQGLKKSRGMSVADKQDIIAKRHEIETWVGGDNEIELKHAVMEADKLVDHVLKIKGYEGETFADRLRFAQRHMDTAIYDQVWQGHKVRNQLAHEHELRVTNQELREAAKKLLNYTRII